MVRLAWAPPRAAALLFTAAALLWLAPSAGAAPLQLLDGRGWEMVSPVEKNGGEVQGVGGNFGGDVMQAAADGESITYSSASSFGQEAQGAPIASQYVSRRTVGGWSTEDVTLPTLAGAYGEEPDGVPYQLFSADLARGLIFNAHRCAAGEECLRGYSLRQSASGALSPSPEAADLRFVGASPDLGSVVLSTCAALVAEATEVPDGKGGCSASAPNLYRWGNGELKLLNILPGGGEGTPGAALAAAGGAVSTDGSRIYWNDSENGYLYLREGTQTKWVTQSLAAPGSFQSATADGSIATFISSAHLYLYSAEANTATDLTPAGGVLGVLGASADASRIYYLSAGGLFLWHEGSTTEVAQAADPSDYPPSTATVRLSADGTRLLFLSSAPLTGYDNTDQNTGKADTEVFLYDATANAGAGRLTCVSCNPSGERPIGPSSIPGAISNGEGPTATHTYKPRALVAEGRRLFFDSRDALVTQDTNADRDVYEWEAEGTGSCTQDPGCLELISSGRSEGGAAFIDASEDGRDAFFLTDGSLVPTDPGAFDVYDAREDGGFPIPTKPIPCEGDACQPLPSPPEDPTPGTLVPTEGNPPLRFPNSHHKKNKPKKHKQNKHHHQRGQK